MFIEKTYTDCYSEIMVHVDPDTDKTLRAYTYRDSVPILYSSMNPRRSRIEENEDDEIRVKTKPSINPVFVNITSPRASRIIDILLENDFRCCEDEE